MILGMFAMLVLGGAVAAGLAAYLMKRGGYGLPWDMTLGLAGSAVGSWIFWAIGVAPEMGLAAVSIVAFTGAGILIIVQRKCYPAVS
jgi:uncharacterized membrane protein YeaQ/YmgE (transglycosylase-associated protein family)